MDSRDARIIRFATIGRSRIAQLWLAAAQTIPDFALAAAYSRDAAAARTFAAQHGASKAYDDLEALADDRDIDAVYIASPNLLHHAQALAMLRRGKHVLLEKPMVVTRAQAEELLDAARAHHAVLLEATRSVLNPAMRCIREALPRLGVLRRAHLHFCQYSSKYDRFKRGEMTNTFDPRLATGGLMDLAVYAVEMMVWLFGQPERVLAANHVFPHGWDAMGTLIAQYPAMQAVLTYSKITQGYAPSEIQGEDGALLIGHVTELNGLRIRMRTGEEQPLSPERPDSDLAHETRAFIDMIRGNLDPAPYNQCSLAAMGILEDARAQFAAANDRVGGGI